MTHEPCISSNGATVPKARLYFELYQNFLPSHHINITNLVDQWPIPISYMPHHKNSTSATISKHKVSHRKSCPWYRCHTMKCFSESFIVSILHHAVSYTREHHQVSVSYAKFSYQQTISYKLQLYIWESVVSWNVISKCVIVKICFFCLYQRVSSNIQHQNMPIQVCER